MVAESKIVKPYISFEGWTSKHDGELNMQLMNPSKEIT
jgi:hypothetical protein